MPLDLPKPLSFRWNGQFADELNRSGGTEAAPTIRIGKCLRSKIRNKKPRL